MKKFHLICLFLALCLFFSSCGAEKTSLTGEDAFTPILRVAIAGEKRSDTRLFYLPESKGCFYLHPQKDGGFMAGFVSTAESISSESVVKGQKDITFALMRETKGGQATLLTENGVDLAFLKENRSQNTPLPENISFENAVFFDSLTLIGETDDLLLLCPVDFKETFVLAEKQENFGGLLCVTDKGKYVWYAMIDESGNYSGIARLNYGESLPSKEESFLFDSFQAVGETGVLFTRLLPDGGALYLFRDLERGIFSSVTVDTPFRGVICDKNGKTLCGTVENEQSGAVHVYDMSSGKPLGTYATPHGIPSPHMAIDDEGSTLYLAVGMENDEILGTLNLLSLKRK